MDEAKKAKKRSRWVSTGLKRGTAHEECPYVVRGSSPLVEQCCLCGKQTLAEKK